MSLDVSEIRDPKPVRSCGGELAINEVGWAQLVLIRDSRDLELSTTPNSANSFFFHEPAHRAVGNGNAFTRELLPNLLCAITTLQAGLVHTVDFWL